MRNHTSNGKELAYSESILANCANMLMMISIFLEAPPEWEPYKISTFRKNKVVGAIHKVARH